MLLSDLLEKLDYKIISGDINTEINRLVYDSRKVSTGDVFVCIKGAVSDGHAYFDDVINKGAAAVIVQQDVDIANHAESVTVVKTDDTRLALAYMSAAYFGYPAKHIRTIGITGTKGKTTTTYMVKKILDKCNIKTGLIGTIETIIGDEKIPSKNTTPESYTIHEYFDRMVKAGCECVVMEVSSQALKYHRTAGINFDIGVFTNLEPDHIGPNEHPDFEDYLRCKSRIFSQCNIGIVNSDDEHFPEVTKGRNCPIETYGIRKKADTNAYNIIYSHKNGKISTEYDVNGRHRMHVELSVPGEFSIYNSLCAIAISRHFDVDETLLKEALRTVTVDGRVEPVKVSEDYSVMIDYAHNAMSLKSLLVTMKEYNPVRLVTVFGCGGNRSKDRRYEMGEISGKLSDLTIITSDNPRYEEPEDIMNDIETGVKKTDGSYVKIEDRGEAIRYAIANAKKGDIIVIAGKGHEDYQEIKGVRYHQTDIELINKAIEDIRQEG